METTSMATQVLVPESEKSERKKITIGEILEKSYSEDRTLHDILGGGTVANLLLWKDKITSFTLILIATKIWSMCEAIKNYFLAQLAMSLNIIFCCNCLLVTLTFFHFLPMVSNCLHQQARNAIRVLTKMLAEKFNGIWVIRVIEEASKDIKNLKKQFIKLLGNSPFAIFVPADVSSTMEEKQDQKRKSLDELIIETFDTIAKNIKDALYDIEIKTTLGQEIIQMLAMISYGNPYIWAIAYLELLTFAAFFYNPAGVLYVGYVCIATMPVLYWRIFSPEQRNESVTSSAIVVKKQ